MDLYSGYSSALPAQHIELVKLSQSVNEVNLQADALVMEEIKPDESKEVEESEEEEGDDTINTRKYEEAGEVTDK